MIRLTKLTDYGIVLMSHLALHGDRRWNAADLAGDTQLPAPMVSKILKLLVRAGLLDSRRGAGGGYLLSKSATEISVADIIGALDGPIALTECSDESTDECSYEAICRVKTNWQRINHAVREALSSVTLQEMAEGSVLGSTDPSGRELLQGQELEGFSLVTLGR